MFFGRKEKIKKTVKSFFDQMGFSMDILNVGTEEEVFSVKIKTDEPQILIGQNGQTLFEIQGLLKTILRRKIAENFYFDLDINDYKKKKAEYLEETANSIADEVSLTKKEKILPPMTSYERRIVHIALSERQDVISQSVGEGFDRRVAIRPKE